MKNNLKKFEFPAYLTFFIILTLPRSLGDFSPTLQLIVNSLKVLAFVAIISIYLIKKLRPSKLTLTFLFFSTLLGLSTVMNYVSPLFFLKVYSLNFAILLLIELILPFKLKFLRFFSNYFLILILLNSALIFLGFLLGHPHGYLTPDFYNYLLGQDNRFILYIIPALLGFFYLSRLEHRSKNLQKFALALVVGLFTLDLLWSTSAFIVLLSLTLFWLIFKSFKVKLNLPLFIILLILISFLMVFFRIQDIFTPIITNFLQKSPTISHRTVLWDFGINSLNANPLGYLHGFGYHDITALTPVAVSHFHNLFINLLFYSGVFGLLAYFYQFFILSKNLSRLKPQIFNFLSLTILALLTLMLFDTFEYYQIYYFILSLIFFAPVFLNRESHD